MKYGIRSLVVLLGVSVVYAHAEYARFIYTPGIQRKEDPNKPPKNPMIPPMVPNGIPGQIQPVSGLGGMQNPVGPNGIPQPMKPKDPPPPPIPEAEYDMAPIRAEIIIEIGKIKKLRLAQEGEEPFQTLQLQHKWGLTALCQSDEVRCMRVVEKKKGVPTVLQKYEELRKPLATKGVRPTPEKLLEIAEFCLTHGLLDKFQFEMEELRKLKPDHPVAKLYKKYSEVDFPRVIKRDASGEWKERLTGYKVLKNNHYALLYNSPIKDPPEVQSRLAQLEGTYKAFFYWFALHGKYVPTPQERLVVIMPDKQEDFSNLHQAFDSQPISWDGFYSRRENLAVFASTPTDEAYDVMSKSTQDLWVNKGWNKDQLLKGLGKQGEKLPTIAYAQEMVLLLRALEEESGLATASHEGSRQLASATGLLPRGVTAPDWLQFGIGSFFETPRGAYWQGTGAPHWIYLMKFKIWEQARKLDSAPDALRKVVSDHYFREAIKGGDSSSLLKANTMTWSLTYFLAQRKLDGLLLYFDELAKLPRDMEFDEQVYLGCFTRAFDLMSPTKPNEIDDARFTKFARDWYRFTLDSQLELEEAMSYAKKEEARRLILLNAPPPPLEPVVVPKGPGQVPGRRPGLPPIMNVPKR